MERVSGLSYLTDEGGVLVDPRVGLEVRPVVILAPDGTGEHRHGGGGLPGGG